MSWDDAIRAAQNDQGYDLTQLTPEQASQLFATKIDPAKTEEIITKLHEVTASNNASAAKLASVLANLQFAGLIGRILLV